MPFKTKINMLKEIAIPEDFKKEIFEGEISQQVFLVNIKFDENKSLIFDMAKSIRERILPPQFNSEKGRMELSKYLDAEIKLTLKGTYSIKKKNSDYYIDSLYLATAKMDGEEYLISFFHGEKQPTLYLTYLDKVFVTIQH